MASGVKGYDENLVGCRVTVWWPKDKSFCEGVVSSHGHSGRTLVFCANGVEEILNRKLEHGEPVNDFFPDQGTGTRNPAPTSSHMIAEADGVKDFGGLQGKGLATQKQDVVYIDGVKEIMSLRKHREPAEDISPDQAEKLQGKARDSYSRRSDDDMDARWHVAKKHKGQSFDLMTSSASSIMSKDQRMQKPEVGIAPFDDGLVNVNGYKVKAMNAPKLEAIFAKYGDIAAHCLHKLTSVRSSLLEVICNIVQKLQYYDVEIILSDLETIENEISDLEVSNMKVLWLHEHLAKVRKVAALRDQSLQLKEVKETSGIVTKAATKDMKQRHAELLIAQERFKEAEKRASAMRLVNRKIEDDILGSKSEEYFWRRQLDDLL